LERAKSGKLYLVPTPLSADSDPVASLPPAALEPLRALRSFVVENEKTALRFLSRVLDRDAMAAVSLAILDEHTPPASVPPLLAPALSGADLGLLSEAGCPAVADPGALLVRAAHDSGVEVVPLLGSSSIVLALMASGMNGQSFRFHGYLPRDRAERARSLKRLERAARDSGETQVFIETPYRNRAMAEDIASTLMKDTRVAAAWDLGGPGQRAVSAEASRFSALKDAIPKLPCTFMIGR